MILQSLNELYTRLADDPSYEIAPPGFSPQKISFRIVLKADGTLVQIADARTKDSRGKLVPNRIEVPAHEKRTSGIKPQFLCDKPEYVLGWTADPSKQSFAENCYDSFRVFHLAQERKINSTAYSAICRFLEKWTPDQAANHPILAEVGSNFGIWVLQGEKRPIHEDEAVKSWWISRQTSDAGEENRGQCLVSGELATICRIHPDIKGFKSSIALVGIQENTAYESYGLSKTENCPVSSEVAFRYATALNALTDGPKRRRHRTRIANTSVVHWTQTATVFEDIFASAFSDSFETPEEAQDPTRIAQINRLLDAVKSGTRFQELGDPKTPFFILGLEQSNPGRFAIRFFHRSTIADLVAKLHDHHECMKIVRSATDPEFPSIRQILSQIRLLHRSEEDGSVVWKEGRDGSDKFTSVIGAGVLRAILEGAAYPQALFSAIIRRSLIERRITYLRASTLKGILIRNHKLAIPSMLDPENSHPAYLHGRLFAVLEKIQEEGYYAQTNQRLKSSIKEKYFSSACATPAAVFPRLETLSVHHQRHLNPGRKVQFDKLIAEIKWLIEGTKKTHTLVEQGMFILGYYHQRKALFQGGPSEVTDMVTTLDPA